MSRRERKRIVIVGAGLAGLATAALLARAGHRVTVLEQNSWVGGKSRRIEVAGQRIDTGPSLVTFPAVMAEFDRRYLQGAGDDRLPRLGELQFERLPEVGRYFYRNHEVDLPVPANHPWGQAWRSFEEQHAARSGDVVQLLTRHPLDARALPAVGRLLRLYGTRLTSAAFLRGQQSIPEELRDIIAIHALNAGIAPQHTLALYASMPAMMAHDGIRVPTGGVYEIALQLQRMAEAAGAEIHTRVRVSAILKGHVLASADQQDEAPIPADLIISAVDTGVASRLLDGASSKAPESSQSCSGVGIFAVFDQPLPVSTVTHSVVMPDNPQDLYTALENRTTPDQTMAFVNYYRPGHIYANTKATAAILLTAPADGQRYELDHPFVQRELTRISTAMGLPTPLQNLIEDYTVFDPHYFSVFGAETGALYGARRPLWASGPFQRPGYRSFHRPWLWRVGASMHPGGGIPAVLGGSMIVAERILRRIGVAEDA